MKIEFLELFQFKYPIYQKPEDRMQPLPINKRQKTRLSDLSAGIMLFAAALVSTAYAQGSGMMGPGMSGMMGFGSHQMDHNLVIPLLALGQDYVSTLSLINLVNTQMMSWVPAHHLGTTGTVYFYKQDGSPILVAVNGSNPVSQMPFSLAPSATVRFELTAAGVTMAGWAFVDIDSTAGGYSWGMMDGQAMTGGMRVMANVSYTYQNGSQII